MPVPRLVALLPAVGLGLLAACSSSPPQYLDEAEGRLGVDTTWYGSDLRVYHAALLNPRGVALRSPGYVVGVENIHPADSGFLQGNDPLRLFGEHHVVTHILRYNLADGAARPDPVPSCALFTLLDRPEAPDDPGHRLFPRCGADHGPELAAGGTASRSQGVAIARFRDSLTDALAAGDFTDILVVVMGWNTDQEEALKNVNSLVGNMADEAGARAGFAFRPLTVAVTWPSEWALGEWSVVPDALVRTVSFPFKRRDANDLGTYVISDLVLHGILPAREAAAGRTGAAPPLTLLGHSFGARALVTSLTRAPGGVAPTGGARFLPVDRMILLQGAFEFAYLFEPDGRLAAPFTGGTPRVTMTASAHDRAVATAFWGWYAGDADTFDQVCRVNRARWEKLGVDVAELGCGAATAGGDAGYGLDLCVPSEEPPVLRPLDAKPVRYLDASSLINCRSPFSGGGAHSDIFRRETARFLLDEMR